MARLASAARTIDDDAVSIVRWYQERLRRPAVFPGGKCRPNFIGPSWQVDERGFWLLPEKTLGWDVLAWTGAYLQLRDGVPWRYTDEQARVVLWWYSLDGDEFAYWDGVLQRLKGWGKDPFGGTLLAVEAFGPARLYDWDRGNPVAVDVEDAWAQTAAVSQQQTRNTMRLFPSLFTARAIVEYGIQIGKEIIYGLDSTRVIEAVTSSPRSLEGPRSTFVLPNETHHWLEGNGGHDMADVIERNTAKNPNGARVLKLTNAYMVGEDSVAERDREAFDLMASGATLESGLMYDSVEAPAKAPMIVVGGDGEIDELATRTAIREVVEGVRGDSVWLNTSRIVKSVLDPRNSPARSRRFWYNTSKAPEDVWCDADAFKALGGAGDGGADGDEIVMFFDGSKSDDATALVGCRVSDGHVITLGVWQRPPGERGRGWLAPRDKVDERVTAIVEQESEPKLKVIAFFGDPGHILDDEERERYWDGLFDEWHRRWGHRFEIWSVRRGSGQGHAVMYDMTAPARVAEFTAAAERFVSEVEDDGTLTHDHDSRLVRHVRNARRAPNAYGVSLTKESRGSRKKIDLAVCAVGARMVRRLVLNERGKKKPKTGRAVFY